jgi:hypothetical protein
MKYDFTKRDLGLGYSYKQRYEALEHFNLNNESNNKYVLILSLILILFNSSKKLIYLTYTSISLMYVL